MRPGELGQYTAYLHLKAQNYASEEKPQAHSIICGLTLFLIHRAVPKSRKNCFFSCASAEVTMPIYLVVTRSCTRTSPLLYGQRSNDNAFRGL